MVTDAELLVVVRLNNFVGVSDLPSLLSRFVAVRNDSANRICRHDCGGSATMEAHLPHVIA